ncbi:glycosyltransferase family 2 protein [Gilvimarinus sp. SDUM040013]|uniref:Glycosyltransferase family 2 protein n=1 Tax=Gilvimarinus gilvus TaxID=3058038 RepID=A0ABU4S3K8_9GAMM|nr:glycosyltransferase family 2 protein [Gilvimarinus sp. SDUM040013]MDO3387402.1 glycosyltransferase family 2 protein [Gilvimarinus sp. SDUM040013]MDX6849879.1 glycosyltransferase family 2 protein [Gilvimarinus sp. SDUM040013]
MSESVLLSAVLIVKNEQDKLSECLKSLQFADEIVVVDAGSTDNTVPIAHELGARVEVAADWQGFGVQRQRAQRLARGRWILCIDADERVSAELAKEIERVIQGDDAIYELNRLSWCFGRFMKHTDMYPDWIPRLYPRERASFDDTYVHERLQNSSRLPVKRLSGDLLHYVYDSVRHLVTKSALYAEHWAVARAANGRKASLFGACLHGFFCFIRMYVLRRGFLDGGQGLLIALVMSHATFVKYADLWVRTKADPPVGDR